MPRKTRGKTVSKTVHAAREQRCHPTPAERKLWEALRNRRLAGLKFRRQHPFGPYVLDAFCVERQLEIQLDGDIHFIPSQKEHDEIRTAFLEANGVRILRFKNEEIEREFDRVLERIILIALSPSPDAGV